MLHHADQYSLMRSISCKGISGKTIIIDCSCMVDLCDWIIELHKQDMPTANLDNYLVATSITDVKLQRIRLTDKPDDFNKLFAHSDLIVLHIMLKSWTMARNYDFTTMTATCPISLETCVDPTVSHCCMTAFERSSLLKCQLCPHCRGEFRFRE